MSKKMSKFFDIYRSPNMLRRYWQNPKPLWHDYLVLAVIFIVFLFGTVLWLSQDTLPPHWDMTQHLTNAYTYYDLLRQGNLARFLWTHYTYYPPLIYQITALLYMLFGTRQWIPHLLMIFFYSVVFSTTYLVGKKIFSRSIGIIAAGITLLIPLNYVFSRDFLLDIPLSAFFLLTLYLLLLNPFQSSKKTVMLGLIMGCGMVTKWTFIAFAASPFVLLLIRAILNENTDLKKLSRSLFCMVLLSSVIAAPWYLFHAWELVRDAQHNAYVVPISEQDPKVGTIQYYGYYLEIVLNQHLYLPLFCCFLFGFYQLFRKKQSSLLLFFSLIILSVYGVFTLIDNKDPRYIAPLIPILCLVAGYGILNIPSQWLKVPTLCFISVYLLVQFSGSIVDLGFLSTQIAVPSINRYVVFYEKKDPPIYFQEKSAWLSPLLGEWILYNPFSYFGRLPRKENWYLGEISSLFRNHDNVFVDIDDDVYFNKNLLVYSAQLEQKKISLLSSSDQADVLITKYPQETKTIQECGNVQLPNEKIIYFCKLS